MNISLFENATFLELVSEFNEYELVIKREKELYSIKIVINNIEYNSSNNNLDECIRDLIVEILENKAQEKSIMIEELINEWKTLEEIIKEIKETW
jgi:hypothetical protein